MIDMELGGANPEQSFDQRVTEVLMRLENGKDRSRGPDVSPLRSASAPWSRLNRSFESRSTSSPGGSAVQRSR